MPSLTAFLDTSVILSGLASPRGGSAALFLAAKKKKIKLVATPVVLEEAVAHLSKLAIQPSKLEALLTSSTIYLTSNPSEGVIEKFKILTTDPDDVHVIAGAVLSGAHVLMSLDKKHITTIRVKKALKPMRVMSPKEFWRWLARTKKRGYVSHSVPKSFS